MASKAELIANLTMAKVDILKLKADHYTWFALLDDMTRLALLDTLDHIQNQLIKLNEPTIWQRLFGKKS
jgi:hypothetical protein